MNEIQTKTAELLGLIWKGIPSDYKSKYRRNIWEQFENQVRAAAYTSSLAKCINQICLKLGATLGTNDKDRVLAAELLGALDDRLSLKALREETTLIVLLVRIANKERQEEAKSRIAENEAIEQGQDLFAERKD